jgi:uncharacterized LabA/DUF88 family protein
VHALVDYDNVKLIRREYTDADVEFNILEIARAVVSCLKTSDPTLVELDIRFYGGWNTQNRAPTDLGQRVFRCVDAARTKLYGVTVRPSVATAPFSCPMATLWGFVRTDSGRKRQKMVDTLMVVDAMSLIGVDSTALVSDDQDMLPALVACHLSSGKIVCLRGNPHGTYFFDDILKLHGIALQPLPEEFRRG